MSFFLSQSCMQRQPSNHIFLWLLLCNFIASPLTQAIENNYLPQKNLTKTTIKVVTETYPPYQFLNENGKLVGCSVDLVNALFKLTKDDLNIQIMPWARAYITALNTKNTLIFSMVRNHIREDKFIWIGTIMEDINYFWGLKRKYGQTKLTRTEVKQGVTAVSRASSNDQLLSDLNNFKLQRVTNINQAVYMLINNRVDFIVDTKIGLQKRFKKIGYDFLKVVPVLTMSELNHKISFAMNINSDPKIVVRYQHAYQQLINSGKIAKILAQCL